MMLSLSLLFSQRSRGDRGAILRPFAWQQVLLQEEYGNCSSRKMALIDHSLVVAVVVTIKAAILYKTDFHQGQRDYLGPLVRRGPHRKPKPERS